MPAGIACSFTTPTLSSQGSVSSTLTLQLATPLYAPVASNRNAAVGGLHAVLPDYFCCSRHGGADICILPS
jgi:hypothetical protein